MDGLDIWRKLIVGTAFDPVKLKKEARRSRKQRARQRKKQTYENPEPAENICVDDNSKQCNENDNKDTKTGVVKTRSEAKKLRKKRARQKKKLLEKGLEDDDSEERYYGELKKRKLGNNDEDESGDAAIGITKEKKEKRELSLLQSIKIEKERIRHFRKTYHIHIEGEDVSNPLETFEQLDSCYGVHPSILSNIKKLEYVMPTPVQMQVIPLMIDERQVLARAPTGSGKTAAFLIPILHQLKGHQNDGYRALILVPTRELAKQIYCVCTLLAEGTNIQPFIIKKAKMGQDPKVIKNHDILISTPNRLIYMLKHDPPLVALDRIQWFVVDESDKLFEDGEQGFLDQLTTVYTACASPLRKCAMFSATYSYEVEQWCKRNLDSVISVWIGDPNTAVTTVKQELVFVGSEGGKLLALRQLKAEGLPTPALIFVQSKERARQLYKELVYEGIRVDTIHADRSQMERDKVMQQFVTGKIWVLICTDVMARGIDINGVQLVINYDFPTSTIAYIHRVGRTGRAGKPGRAVTFFTEADKDNLRGIAQIVKNAGGDVPEYMLKLKKQKKKKGIAIPIKRDEISTVPQYVIDKEAKKKQLIKNSKRKTWQKQNTQKGKSSANNS